MQNTTLLLTRIVRTAIALLLMGMVVLTFTNVVLRYAANSGLSFSEELSRWFYVWLVFIGSILALYERGHIAMEGILHSLPRPMQSACNIASALMMVGVSWLILKGSYKQSWLNLGAHAPATGLPMLVYYLPGVIFGIASIAILLVQLVDVIRHGGPPDADSTQSGYIVE
ncbi:TRAP transporter small permease [Ensifer adhaerens]|jgi:TRAP-type C4-dicarboxylate transport system permease small subunit|uniref:TRAP transporter small permease n=1 Tax=Ensifer adhaerens TaxID=106592 RepID=UPI00202EAB2D|nr:TRAP transporter small permease [Ensifer adhaerens]